MDIARRHGHRMHGFQGGGIKGQVQHQEAQQKTNLDKLRESLSHMKLAQSAVPQKAPPSRSSVGGATREKSYVRF